MSVSYKFKSALTYDTIQLDDLHISLQDFEKAVVNQKHLGKSFDCALQVTNEETNEVYDEQNSLIPKNSSLIVARVPLAGTQKKWDTDDSVSSRIGTFSSSHQPENVGQSVDLASGENEIKVIPIVDYGHANYQKVNGSNLRGKPYPGYLCHKCKVPGHWIKECPFAVVPNGRKSEGIAAETSVKTLPKHENDENKMGSAILAVTSAATTARTRLQQLQYTTATFDAQESATFSRMPRNQLRSVGNPIRLFRDEHNVNQENLSPGWPPHSRPRINEYSVLPPTVPNTSELPPNYNNPSAMQQTIHPHFATEVLPMRYGPPPGAYPLNSPSLMVIQPPRIMSLYDPSTSNESHIMRGGYRPHQIHPHPNDGYSNRNNVVEDPVAVFESYLRERDRQDRMKRSHIRRSHSKSFNRWKSRSRSLSPSSSNKRSSRSPVSRGMHEESLFARKSSRTSIGVSRRSDRLSHGRLQSRSRSPHCGSRSSSIGMKKKRS